MLHPSTLRLVMTLCDLTARGDVGWREGENGASRLETEGYVVEVTPTPSGLRILDGDGREIETVTEADLASASTPDNPDLPEAVRLMAERAHRIARGAEKAIALILSSLSAPSTAKPGPGSSPVSPELAANDFSDEPAGSEIARDDPQPDGGDDAHYLPANDVTTDQPPGYDAAPAALQPPVQVADRAEKAVAQESAAASHPPVATPPPPARGTARVLSRAPLAPAPTRPLFGSIKSFARQPQQQPQPQAQSKPTPATSAAPYKPWRGD